MAIDNDNLLLTSSPGFYDNKNIMVELAKYHFPEMSDVGQLKTGVVGYTITAMSKAVSENALMRIMDGKESFLNTASTAAAILTFAKQYEYDVGLATPASNKVLLCLPLTEIKASLDTDNKYILNKDQPVYINNVEFLLPAEVLIYINSDSSINVKYNLASTNITMSSSEEYIRSYTQAEVIDNVSTTFLCMELRCIQMVRRTNSFSVISSTSNVQDSIRFPVSIPDGEQLSSFEVRYKPATSDDYITLTKLFNEKRTTTATNYCFYTFEGGDTGMSNLVVYFSSATGGFRPEYNSVIEVVCRNTLGTSGNFTYTGDPVFVVTRFDGAAMYYLSSLITQPSGGKDRETLLEVKNGCLRKSLYRESIVIEKDLESHLDSVVASTQVNGSKVTFVKYRDDVLYRQFYGFLNLIDGNGYTIPANTVDLSISYSKLESKGWVLKPGDIIVYDKDTDKYRLTEDYEYPINFLKDTSAFAYCIPYYMKITKTPYPSVSYIRNDTNTDLPVATEKTFDSYISKDSFIINSIQVKRNSVFENRYLITVNIGSTIDAASLAAKVVPRLYFNNSEGSSIGYIDLTYESGTSFVGVLNTNDEYNDDIELAITNSLYNEVGNVMASASFPESVYFNLALYYNSVGGSGRSITGISEITKDDVIYQLIQKHNNTSTPVKLFTKLDYIMASDLVIQDTGVFNIGRVPLIGANFFLNTTKYEEINKLIDVYQNALNDAFSLLGNNTSVNLKFHNSYGYSKYFNTDRTNLAFYFQMNVNNGSETLKDKIKASIVKFINDSNNDLKTVFNLSNLITYLESTYSAEINSIRFKTLNGTNTQYISPIYSTTTLEQDNSRIPEILNVSTRIDQSGNYYPDIRIDFI